MIFSGFCLKSIGKNVRPSRKYPKTEMLKKDNLPTVLTSIYLILIHFGQNTFTDFSILRSVSCRLQEFTISKWLNHFKIEISQTTDLRANLLKYFTINLILKSCETIKNTLQMLIFVLNFPRQELTLINTECFTFLHFHNNSTSKEQNKIV